MSTGKAVGEDFRLLNVERSLKELVIFRHEGGGNLTLEVGLATFFPIESIEDAERGLVESNRKPCDGERFLGEQGLRAFEEICDFLFLSVLRLQLNNASLVMIISSVLKR